MCVNNFNSPTAANNDWVLFVQRLPGRLNAEQAARIVGCQSHDISALVRAKLLRPLGGAKRNAVKYFSATKLVMACADDRWLDKVTKTIAQSRKKADEDTVGQVTEVEGDSDPDS